MNFIDLRSDTVTEPTEEMRKAMFEASVGDDVYGDDETVRKLEYAAANITGKEASLFVPSGTFGNQLSLFTHCKRGQEVILGDSCHIVMHEVGAASVIAGVQLRTIEDNKGELPLWKVKNKIRSGEDDIHFPSTGLICVENAHSNGRVISLSNMKEIYEIAADNSIPVHLDGARVFNAASYLNVDVKEITKYCDSVMFCLSKGLCAPVGSMLAGSKQFIDKARKNRKLMGGGLRQAGFLAAAGLIALEKMTKRVEKDHKRALLLANELSKLPYIEVYKDDIHINMVFFKITNKKINSSLLVNEFYKNGIKINGEENGLMRFVTHYWINDEHVFHVVNTLKNIINNVDKG